MDKATKLRKVLRSSFTRQYNALQKLLDDRKLEEAKVAFKVLEHCWTELHGNDQELFNSMLEDHDASEEDIEKEIATNTEYEYKFEWIKMQVMEKRASEENSVRNDDLKSNVSNFGDCSYSKLNLPPIKIDPFDGEIRNWLPFWGQFEQIHLDESIPTFHKFRILLQSLKEGTRAKQVVDSFPISKGNENYDAAICALKERFGREDLLIEVYIRELLSIIINNKQSQLSVIDMYDKLECHLRFLEILGITTGKCAAILCPLLESCMSEEFLRTWQRSYSSDEVKDAEQRLTKFREFIKTEVQNEQRISLAISKFGIADEKSHFKGKREYVGKMSPKVPTAMGLFTAQETKQKPSCIFCNQPHNSLDCFKAREMTYDDKLQCVRDAKCCYICLKRFHMSKQCKTKSTCLLCSKKHATIVCPNFVNSKSVPSDKPRNVTDVNTVKDDRKPVTNVTTSLTCDSSVILPTVQVNVKGSDGQRYTARAVFDTAAQRSYILNTTADNAHCKVLGQETLHHSLFGGNRLKSSVHNKYEVQLESLNQRHTFSLEALGQDVICGVLPTLPSGPWVNHMIDVGVPVGDVLNDTGDIDLLVGADFAASLFTGRIEKIPNSSLVCIETYLGWTVSGKVPNMSKKVTAGMLTTNMFVSSANPSDLWRLDLIGIEEPTAQMTKEQKYSEVNKHFLDTVTINEEGRYEVDLPWKQDHTVLPSNYDIASKRLKTTCNKLTKDKCFELYQTVFNEWITEGVIEEVTGVNSTSEGHFLPHRPVFKLNSSTKVRPVFDASAHGKGSPSLNDCLNTGCNLIEQLTSLIHRFRLHKIGVVADIRRAFLQISINPTDREFLKFLWYDYNGQTIVYRHKRVVFGLTSSPYLLAAVIQYHLERTREKTNKDNSSYSLSTIDYLKGCFYVDNVVISFDSQDEVQTFMREATSVMAEGRFDLRAWEYTDPQCDSETLTPVLGVNWNRREDMLSINTSNFDFVEGTKITKRVIMSAAHRVFDPIGVVSPVTVCPKLLLKELWGMKLDWDEEVPDHIKTQFIKWMKELKYLEQIRVPRWLGLDNNVQNVSVHTFTDASENSYAAAVFVRIETQHEVKVQLVQSKTRVSPVKKITIPRLELLAATIGSRLFNSVKDLFPENSAVYFWTDSTTVIAWLKRKEHWAVFVANRIQEISETTPIEHWNHVPGVKNPADLPSRGCLGKKLVDLTWWEGPDWLYLPQEQWPKHDVEFNEEHISGEKRKTAVSMGNQTQDSDWYYKYFSNYEKLIRMFAWITRFVNNCRAQRNNNFTKETGVLSTEEIRLAEETVCKLVQQDSFQGAKDPSIATLQPFEDQRGLIRLKTKISNRSDSLDFRFPILLPKNHPVVIRLIRSIHEAECHVGVKGLLAITRERFWIVGGRRTLKSAVSTCVTCKRYDSRRIETPAIPLPVDRVRDASAFEVVGVDLAGPVYLKDGQKAWICLFTCAVVRAVHLELVQSLSTEDFLMALRRFIARRGRPVRIYSDHGTNFVGCANLFENINWNKVLEYCNLKRISWKFNPPTAAWWGGWWERLIGVTKRLLRRVIKKSVLTYQEMETVLCDCESVVNSRPLTYISEGESEATAITPSLFIQDIRESGMPELEVIERTDLRKKLQHRTKIQQDFRERFRAEYLGLLQSRTKNTKSRDIKIGDIVMIGNDNLKRMDWPIGRVVAEFPGKDGKVRLVRVKTAYGECLRPVQRLYQLLEDDVEIKCLQRRLPK